MEEILKNIKLEDKDSDREGEGEGEMILDDVTTMTPTQSQSQSQSQSEVITPIPQPHPIPHNITYPPRPNPNQTQTQTQNQNQTQSSLIIQPKPIPTNVTIPLQPESTTSETTHPPNPEPTTSKTTHPTLTRPQWSTILSLSRSYRVGWGPNGQWGMGTSDGRVIWSTPNLNPNPDPHSHHHHQEIQLTLTSHLTNLTLELPDSLDSPTFSPHSAPSSSSSSQPRSPPKLPHAKLIPHPSWSHLARVTSDHPELFSPYEIKVWSLLPILFKPPTTIDGTTNRYYNEIQLHHTHGIQQNQGFSRWLSDVIPSDKLFNSPSQVELTTDHHHPTESETNPLERILHLVLHHQIESACHLAVQAGYPRLATLLAQAGGDPGFKSHLRQQLITWFQANTMRAMPLDLIRIYLVLVGTIPPSESLSEEPPLPGKLLTLQSDLTRRLTWLHQLALHFWYGSEYEDAIVKALLNLDATYPPDDKKLSHPPNPPFGDSHRDPSQRHDSIYHLLKFYDDPNYPIRSILESTGFDSNPRSRCNWLLFQSLRPIIPDSVECTELNQTLTLEFSDQLQVTGDWEWSILVLLHLEDPTLRSQTIQQVLFRHVELNSPDDYRSFPSGPALLSLPDPLLTTKDSFLQGLGIPLSWIHLAKAQRAYHHHQYMWQLQHLLLAGEWWEAHQVFLYRLAPPTVFESGFTQLRDLISQLSPYPLPHWSTPTTTNINTGKLYKDYLDLHTAFQLLLPTPPTITPSHLVTELPQTLHRAQELLTTLLTLQSPSPRRHLLPIPPTLAHTDNLPLYQLAITEMVTTLLHYLSTSLITSPTPISPSTTSPDLTISLATLLLRHDPTTTTSPHHHHHLAMILASKRLAALAKP